MSMHKINKVFKKEKNIIIGALHFPPLLGYPDFPGFETILKNAYADLEAFQNGGIDGIIFENNYDIPHKEFVDSEIVASMTYLGEKLKNMCRIPLGISVLWNDYKTALSIAKILKLQFIRIPVFVDDVKTNYGKIYHPHQEIKNYQRKINAENILLFTDIHVKHSKILSKHSITESAKLAIQNGSDALIITGKWTGDAPNLLELKNTRKAVGNFPLLIGSGADQSNVSELLKYANGAIISTSLKEGDDNKNEVNIKNWKQRIAVNKVLNFKNIVNNTLNKFN